MATLACCSQATVWWFWCPNFFETDVLQTGEENQSMLYYIINASCLKKEGDYLILRLLACGLVAILIMNTKLDGVVYIMHVILWGSNLWLFLLCISASHLEKVITVAVVVITM